MLLANKNKLLLDFGRDFNHFFAGREAAFVEGFHRAGEHRHADAAPGLLIAGRDFFCLANNTGQSAESGLFGPVEIQINADR